MKRAGVTTPTATTAITKLMQKTNASVAAARNTKVLINWRTNSSGSGRSNNNNNNNNNNNSSTSEQTQSARQSKYLTWYKIVSVHNNNDNYTYKSNNYNESCYSKSNIATTTTRRNEQIGNVDGNAGGNGSVRVAHTGNANKSGIRKSENSYYSVNKFVLATNERRSVSERHVNKSLVNSVNKNKNKRKSKNKSRAISHSSQVKEKIAKAEALANITRLQFDPKRQIGVNNFNKSVGAGVGNVSESAENNSQNFIDNQKKDNQIFSKGFPSRAQISTHDKQQLLAINNSSTIAATTTTTTESTRLDYIVITDYNRPRKRSFWQKYGRILLIAIGISLSVACISVLIVAINCYRVTALKRRATVALTLPIPLLPEDQTLLHTEPDNPVPMLSVQTAGYAGMERLGVPTRTTLNSPPDDRGQYSCRMRVETLPARDILVRSETVIHSNSASGGCTSACMTTTNCSGNKNQQQQQLLSQEHHNQHSHHHHQYQQHYQHHHNQQQHYQRMSAQQQEQQQQQSACSSASSARNGNMPARSTTSISNSNSSSNFMRGGIEAATLKYGSMGSRSGGAGAGGAGGVYGCSISSSSCGSNSSCNSHSIDHHQHYQQAKQLKQQRTPRCPHHVPLPDSEWGQDRNMQIRASYQQSELTRSYIKPPPNKTIKDVPEQSSYNFNALSALSGSNIALYATPATSTAQPQQQQQAPKSKPNVITKLFSRKSSPKSPTALASSSSSTSACSSLPSSASVTSMPASASSSTSSIASAAGGAAVAAAALSPSVSTSSSPSSLASAPLASMPISTASTLKTTACSYGASSLQACTTPPSITAGLVTSTQLLTTIGVSPTATPASIERIPTPPLSVTVPIGGYHHHHHHHHHNHNQHQQRLHQQEQQILLDNIVAESATPTASLHSLKSSSCNLATAGAAERNSSRSSLVAMDCYPLTAAAAGGMTPRSRTPTTLADNNYCNCNSKDCKTCTPNAAT